MSFGFSIGDIILLSQLSYKLYASITTGRRGAGRDLKELEDVLFSLRCALDHLRTVAKDILVTAQNSGDNALVDMRKKLDLMIDSCASTLQDLDTMTQKYRDGTKPTESGGNDNQSKKVLLARLKQNININWMKVRWDRERYSLQYYRDKLRSHADAINIVMNSYLWSTTHRIETGEKTHFEKMQGLLNEALQSNTTLLQLVTEIHSKLHASIMATPPQAEKCVSPSISKPKTLSFEAMGPQKMNFLGAVPPFTNVALMAIAPFPDASDDYYPKPSIEPYAMKTKSLSKKHIAPYIAPNLTPKQLTEHLPAPIIALNNRRVATGLKEFEEFKAKNARLKQLHKPSFLTLDKPSLPQLHDGLTFIFRPFTVKMGNQARNALDERKNEIVRWTHGFDQFLNSWQSQTIPSSSRSEAVGLEAKQNDAVDLLVHLNELIEQSDWKLRKLFYNASTQAQIDDVLDKLQTVSKSVRVEKAVEEFEDERAEWVSEYEGG